MTDDSATVPASPDGYRPIFESRPGIPQGVTIDTAHPRFKSATEAAHRAGLTQRQFSALLTHEVESTVRAQGAARQPTAAPSTPAPAVPAAPKPYAAMTFAEKLAAGGHV